MKEDGENVAILYNLSMVYLVKNDLSKATSTLRKAQRIAPRDPDINYALGLILLRQKGYQAAIVSFKETLAIDPGYTSANQGIAVAESRLKR